MEIPDDMKMFLRAVLVSSPGMQQSRVAKEYYETTDERIEYFKYGYTNIYQFLLGLEGEVTRLEFSPKHGDNLVYAVLDKTKYASKHAQKYASKSNTGLKSKSPEQILSWRKEQNAKGISPVVAYKRPSQSRNRQGRNYNQRRKAANVPKPMLLNKPFVAAPVTRKLADTVTRKLVDSVTREVAATVSEWFDLRKLLPESDNIFTLSVREIGVVKTGSIPRSEICSHFASYNIISHHIVFKQGVTLISFQSYFTAYRAWKEKNKSILLGRRIGIEPAGGNVNTLSTGVYNVMVIDLPANLIMSTFVTKFARFSALVCIDTRPRENCAIISYSMPASAQRACTEVTNITVNGTTVKLNVQQLEERPSLSSGTTNSNVIKPVENKSAQGSKTEPLIKSADVPITSSSISTKSAESPTTSTPPANCDANENTDLLESQVCRFCITYQQWFQMFQITRRKKPRMLQDMPDGIEFLVTHQTEPIRFWGWLMQGNTTNLKKLEEIEKSITSTAVKVQPPTMLPKAGHRGAALYKDGENENWYRCYVLSSDVDNDKIEVFYCDYGNSEFIPRDLFRSTYNDVWLLDPQAIPFKMHGFELNDDLDIKSIQFFSVSNSQILQATVIKSSSYSEPHIIEIRDVTYVSSKLCIDKEIIGSWSIPVEELAHEEESSEDIAEEDEENIVEEEKPLVITSIFDYNEEDLVIGILCEAHHPSLVYLKLGDVSQFHPLQLALDKEELSLPSRLEKEDVLLLSVDDQRRRVLILQVLAAFGKVKILHVDYGVIEWVALKDLYQLSRDLQTAHFQARPASLAGVYCEEKLTEVIAYLKGKSNIVVKANVIHESSSGKICVELFDVQRNISINKELIENKLAVYVVNEVTDTSNEFTPHMLPIPVKELEAHFPQAGLLPPPVKRVLSSGLPPGLPPPLQPVISTILPPSLQPAFSTALPPLSLLPRSKDIEIIEYNHSSIHTAPEAAHSHSSWHSHSEISFPGDEDHSDFSNIPKLMEVSTWLDKSPLKGGGSSRGASSDQLVDSIITNLIELNTCANKEDKICESFKNNSEIVEEHTGRSQDRDNKIENVMSMKNEDYHAVSPNDVYPTGHIFNKFEDHITNLDNNTSLCIDYLKDFENNSIEKERCKETISYENFYQELIYNENNGICYPPPDIIPSNKENSATCKDTSIDNRTIKIDGEVMNFDINNRLDPNQVNKMRYKWEAERKKLVTLEKKLRRLLHMSSDDVNTYYIDVRKEKLQLQLSMKEAQKYSNELEAAYAAVIQETNQMLSLI